MIYYWGFYKTFLGFCSFCCSLQAPGLSPSSLLLALPFLIVSSSSHRKSQIYLLIYIAQPRMNYSSGKHTPIHLKYSNKTRKSCIIFLNIKKIIKFFLHEITCVAPSLNFPPKVIRTKRWMRIISFSIDCNCFIFRWLQVFHWVGNLIRSKGSGTGHHLESWSFPSHSFVAAGPILRTCRVLGLQMSEALGFLSLHPSGSVRAHTHAHTHTHMRTHMRTQGSQAHRQDAPAGTWVHLTHRLEHTAEHLRGDVYFRVLPLLEFHI